MGCGSFGVARTLPAGCRRPCRQRRSTMAQWRSSIGSSIALIVDLKSDFLKLLESGALFYTSCNISTPVHSQTELKLLR